jgi:hypothetical protein
MFAFFHVNLHISFLIEVHFLRIFEFMFMFILLKFVMTFCVYMGRFLDVVISVPMTKLPYSNLSCFQKVMVIQNNELPNSKK